MSAILNTYVRQVDVEILHAEDSMTADSVVHIVIDTFAAQHHLQQIAALPYASRRRCPYGNDTRSHTNVVTTIRRESKPPKSISGVFRFMGSAS